jgi:hypothetical protein
MHDATPAGVSPDAGSTAGAGTTKIPPLAGVCTYEEAGALGFGVDENVALLKRYNWVETRLTELMLTQLNSTAEWEVKGALALHLFQDSEHARWLQDRVSELRHPPHNFHTPPDELLNAILDEALRSQGTVELLTAIVRVIRPALIAAYRAHLRDTNPLVDHPTRRLLRFALIEEEEAMAWGEQALAALTVDPEAREAAAAWEQHLQRLLAVAGGISGRLDRTEPPPQPRRAAAPLEPEWRPRRDSRFESYNYHFPPHWVYAQRDRPAGERMLALVCKRLLEMDVPEMMAAIVWRANQEAPAAGKPRPWAYTADMCRQIWDEARHSMMGEVWLTRQGIPFWEVPLNVGFSLGLNQLATAREAHAALYWIEQGLMPRTTGKAYEWRTAHEAGEPLSTLFMDYDWADEVLHVHIGRRWLVRDVGSREEAERLGAEAFARVMSIRRKRGLDGARETEQSEWWPAFCERVLGYRPQPLAPEVYETPDADAPWLRNG